MVVCDGSVLLDYYDFFNELRVARVEDPLKSRDFEKIVMVQLSPFAVDSANGSRQSFLEFFFFVNMNDVVSRQTCVNEMAE